MVALHYSLVAGLLAEEKQVADGHMLAAGHKVKLNQVWVHTLLFTFLICSVEPCGKVKWSAVFQQRFQMELYVKCSDFLLIVHPRSCFEA